MDIEHRRIKRGWMDLRVVDLYQDTHDTRTLYLQNEGEHTRIFDFVAGQYLTFRFDHLAAKPLARSYTISSSPTHDPHIIGLTVKEIPGGVVSPFLCQQVQVGHLLRARGPMGGFCYDAAKDQPHLFMIAGGSGVTPFVSIMREYATAIGPRPRSMTLLVAFRSRNDLICWPSLEAVQHQTGCKVWVALSQDQSPNFLQGRIHPDMIYTLCPHLGDTTFMTCGPDALMSMVVAALTQKGIPESCIKTESFA